MPLGSIVWLRPEHLNQLEVLLDDNGLPSEDCSEQGNIFCGIFERAELIAAGGLESAADYSLLRSIVVKPHCRGRGLAASLAGFLLEQARSRNSTAVYLLTETAAEYFENLGFAPVARAQVPAAIATTRQFSSLCPDNASCLMMDLSRDQSSPSDAE